ncbi:hypothetical protein [Legionella pneumophila]|nr:hypothetical protein [Legionella pneumophila]
MSLAKVKSIGQKIINTTYQITKEKLPNNSQLVIHQLGTKKADKTC